MSASDPITVRLDAISNGEAIPLRQLELFCEDKIPIGRASSNDSKGLKPGADNAIFTCPVVSRKHATLCARSGPGGPYVCLTDNESMHGTFRNDTKLTSKRDYELIAGDILRFGSEVLRDEERIFPLKFMVGINYPVRNRDLNYSPKSHTFEVPDSTSSEAESDLEDDISEFSEQSSPSSEEQLTPPEDLHHSAHSTVVINSKIGDSQHAGIEATSSHRPSDDKFGAEPKFLDSIVLDSFERPHPPESPDEDDDVFPRDIESEKAGSESDDEELSVAGDVSGMPESDHLPAPRPSMGGNIDGAASAPYVGPPSQYFTCPEPTNPEVSSIPNSRFNTIDTPYCLRPYGYNAAPPHYFPGPPMSSQPMPRPLANGLDSSDGFASSPYNANRFAVPRQRSLGDFFLCGNEGPSDISQPVTSNYNAGQFHAPHPDPFNEQLQSSDKYPFGSSKLPTIPRTSTFPANSKFNFGKLFSPELPEQSCEPPFGDEFSRLDGTVDPQPKESKSALRISDLVNSQSSKDNMPSAPFTSTKRKSAALESDDDVSEGDAEMPRELGAEFSKQCEPNQEEPSVQDKAVAQAVDTRAGADNSNHSNHDNHDKERPCFSPPVTTSPSTLISISNNLPSPFQQLPARDNVDDLRNKIRDMIKNKSSERTKEQAEIVDNRAKELRQIVLDQKKASEQAMEQEESLDKKVEDFVKGLPNLKNRVLEQAKEQKEPPKKKVKLATKPVVERRKHPKIKAAGSALGWAVVGGLLTLTALANLPETLFQ